MHIICCGNKRKKKKRGLRIRAIVGAKAGPILRGGPGRVCFVVLFFKRVAYLKKEKKKNQILVGGNKKGPADKASLGAWCILGTDRAKRF